MARQYRFDRGLTIESRPPQKRKDGSVRFDAILTRTGVFAYQQADGTVRREYRSPAEVGRADSLASLELAHFTLGHPSKPGLAKGLAVGSVGDDIKFDGRYVSGAIIVRDDAAIRAIERGDAAETSCGYSIDYVPQPGMSPEGEAYDGLQTNIEYEHVAGVSRGRAGSSVRLRTDAADVTGWRADAAVMVDPMWNDVMVIVHSASLSCVDLERAVRDAVTSIEGATVAAPPKFDAADAQIKPGAGYDQGYPAGRAAVRVSTRELSLTELTTKLKAGLAQVDATVGNDTDPVEQARRAAGVTTTDRADSAGQENHAMITPEQYAASLKDAADQKTRADAAEKALATEKARADKAEGERDAARERADKAEKDRTDAAIAAPKAMRERLQLEDTAKRVLGADYKTDAADGTPIADVVIKRAVVEKLTGKALPADKSADYVTARFDGALELAGESVRADADLRTAVVDASRKDAVESEADAAKRMRERNAALSKNTQPGSN